MKFRKATEKDIKDIVAMLVDDALGSQRENFKFPIPVSYQKAFANIEADPNQELIVIENENAEVIGTLQLSFIQ